MATTGFQAGTESNATILSYGAETTWGTLPAVAFQQMRYESETLSLNKVRNRPGEIPTAREAIQAVTTQQDVSGAVNVSFSRGAHTTWLCAVLGSAAVAGISLVGVAADITITSGTRVLSSTTANKFAGIAQGTFLKLAGFTNAGNNDLCYVQTVTDTTHLVLLKVNAAAPFVTETPAGTSALVTANTNANGSVFQSFYVQQQLSSSLFLQYPGLVPIGATISGGVGQFIRGSFDCLAMNEVNAVTNASTGAVTAATTGAVYNPVGNFRAALLNGVPIGNVLQKFSLSIKNTGAATEFGMGVSSSAGILQGLIEVTGSFDVYFRDFTLYQNFQNETQGALSFVMNDGAAVPNYFAHTVLNANIFSKINAGGPNQPVMASFTIEGNPMAGGGTYQFDHT
jgi:hypothetical protein